MKIKILREFFNSKIKIKSQERLEEYVDYCIKNNQEKRIKGKTSHHHVLPNKLFPEYGELGENKWNGTHVLYSDHYYAHWLLTEAIDNYSMLSAFCAMHNQDKKLERINEEDLIPKDEFQRKMEERSDKYREWVKNNPKKAKSMSEKRLNSINWETFGASVSKGLKRIEENGLSVATNSSRRKMARLKEENPNFWFESAASRRSLSPSEEQKRIEKSTKTRNMVGEDGLTSFQRGAKKGAKTSTTTIEENGLSIAQNVGIKSYNTRLKNGIIKYGSKEAYHKASYGGAKNGSAKSGKIYNPKDEVVYEFKFIKEILTTGIPFGVRGHTKENRLYEADMHLEFSKKTGKIQQRYIKLVESGLIKYKGYYVILD